MALFSKKQNTKEEKPEATKAPEAAAVPEQKVAVSTSASSPRPVRVQSALALKNPRITEKGALMAESGCYVFDVERGADKRRIALAVEEIYGVRPRLVRVAAIPRKRRVTRGTNRMGSTAGGKKAYVYLKRGDKIDIA